MEFTNEIFFNKNLIANETIIITYCGKLYREHSKEISIVYGFGDNWEHTSETPMKENENGFEATINLKDYNTFNFCFKNNYNIWDNNFGFNYISPISEKITEISENNSIMDSTNTIEDSNINENIDEPTSSIENNTTESSTISSDIGETTEESKINETEENNYADSSETDSNTENTDNFQIQNDSEIESVFASLLDSILDMQAYQNTNTESIDINSLNDFGLKSIDDVKEEDFVDCNEIFKEFYEELSNIPTDNVEKSEVQEDDLDKLFNTLFQTNSDTNENMEAIENLEPDYEKFETEELDNLMDNILNSIINSDESSDITSTSSIENIETNTTQQDSLEDISVFEAVKNSDSNNYSELPALKSESLFDKCIDASYRFFKKAQVACKKFGKLIKIKAKEYGIIKD